MGKGIVAHRVLNLTMLFRAMGGPATHEAHSIVAPDRLRYRALADLKQWLQRQAERGVSEDRIAVLRRELTAQSDRLVTCGFAPLAGQAHAGQSFSAWLIQANYVCMQYERLMDDGEEESLER